MIDKLTYDYFVTGTGPFPFDALSDGACWPVTPIDAQKMNMPSSDPTYLTPRSIRMRSYKPPEPDYWYTYGWSVGLQPLDEFKS